MIYTIDFTKAAKKDIARLKYAEPGAYKKFLYLLEELQQHPESGTGHPKPLGGDRVGQWSRKITSKHRLIYMIDNEEIIVLVLSSYGHYADK